MATSEDFKKALDDMWVMHNKKNKDYGSQADPYQNVRGSQDWGVAPWVGAMIRATDKHKRLQKYARDGQLANEGAEDSLVDNAVYAVIALVLWRESQKDAQ